MLSCTKIALVGIVLIVGTSARPACAGVRAQNDPVAGSGAIVAVVNGEPISRIEFGRSLVRSLGRSAMETVVDWVLVEQEARRRGITVADAELAARKELEVELGLRAVMDRVRMGPEEFRIAAERHDWDLAAVPRQLQESVRENALRVQLLVERMLEPQMDLSDDALRSYYERTRGRRYAAAHIVVRTRRQAESLLTALERDRRLWPEAVLQTSLDRASVPYKGRIGPVPASSELGQVLAGMEPEEMKLHGGRDYWHLLRLIKEVPPADEKFEDTREQLRAELIALTARAQSGLLLADLNAKAHIVINLSSDPEARRILGEEAAAFVNGEPLWVSDLAATLIEEFGRAMLEPYVERALILQEARRRGLTVSDEELEARMLAIAEQLFEEQALQQNVSAQQFGRSLLAVGVEVADFKENLLQELVAPDDVRATLLAEKMVAGGVEITEADLQEVYREFCGERLIVKEAAVDSRPVAQRMHHRIKQGASFDLTARTESTEPGLWMDRGLILSVTSSDAYYPYVKDLEEGEVSGVFEHQGKYRIIKLLRRHTPSEPPSLESVRQSVEQEVFLRKARKRIRALLLKLKVEANIDVRLK